MMKKMSRLILIFLCILASCNKPVVEEKYEGIEIYLSNNWYWQYKQKPVLLLGASDYHNIFQRDNIVEELELLQKHGGNYVRNTMASREITNGHRDLWPYKLESTTEDSLINIYNLEQWNDSYWSKFGRMLEETAKRDIIVEVEIWERHDCYRTRDQAGWLRHPFNPDNNINYTEEESGMPAIEWPNDSNTPGHPFFNTVPSLNDNQLILSFQKAFVDKILSYTMNYDHVLYNMNNETVESHLFADYWADYILQKAKEINKHIELTDMPDAHDITDETILRVLESDVYTFTDISQNNFQKGELHWERIQYVRDHLKDNPKPITNIKIYGADWAPGNVDFWGNSQEAKYRFWRNILAGTSSARFHRRPWGLGNTQLAMSNVRSMRMLTDEMDFFSHLPMLHLLSEREPNEAFCMAIPGKEYVVYFPASGEVMLNGQPGKYKAKWLDIDNSAWDHTFELELPSSIKTDEEYHRVLFLKR
jgi:hypothetical protein